MITTDLAYRMVFERGFVLKGERDYETPELKQIAKIMQESHDRYLEACEMLKVAQEAAGGTPVPGTESGLVELDVDPESPFITAPQARLSYRLEHGRWARR